MQKLLTAPINLVEAKLKRYDGFQKSLNDAIQTVKLNIKLSTDENKII